MSFVFFLLFFSWYHSLEIFGYSWIYKLCVSVARGNQNLLCRQNKLEIFIINYYASREQLKSGQKKIKYNFMLSLRKCPTHSIKLINLKYWVRKWPHSPLILYSNIQQLQEFSFFQSTNSKPILRLKIGL